MATTTELTATTAGARDHARAQAGAAVAAMPTIPPQAAAGLPPEIDPITVVWDETVPGGGYAQAVLAAGTALRLTDLDGDAAAHTVLFSADRPWERLCTVDTVKVMWQAYVSAGHPLLSDQGRVLATLVVDGSGHHDALCGTSTLARNLRRYGAGEAHGPTPAGRELLAVAAAKHGLERRDLPPSLCLLKGARVAADGSVAVTGGAGPGGFVELRCEMPLVVLIANVPHPLDARAAYLCSPLRVTAWQGRPTAPGDAEWSGSPEAARAFAATDAHLRARGLR